MPAPADSTTHRRGSCRGWAVPLLLLIACAAAILWAWRVSEQNALWWPRAGAEVAATRLQQGRLLLERGRLREAERAFLAAAAAAPASSAPRKARIGVLGLQRRGADQEAALWELFEHSLNRPEVRVEALCLLARGGPVIPGESLRPGEDEGMALNRAFRADPEDSDTRAALAFFLRNRGKLDEARSLLEPWVRTHGDVPPVGDEFLALLLDEGRLDEAGRLFDASAGAGAKRLSTPRRLLLRGIWEASRGHPAAAIDAFRAAIRDDPRDPEPHHRLAQALRAAGREPEAGPEQAWVEAAQALRRLVDRLEYAAPDPVSIARASELCRAMGRVREADAWRGLTGQSLPSGTSSR